MFGPKVLEEHHSEFSGQVRLMQGWGYKYVATGSLTQSGGVVADVWKPVLKKLARISSSPLHTWLILGLGAGTLAHMISDQFHPSRLVGVEIDSLMLDLGRRHFSLNRVPNLEVLQQDAHRYVRKARDHFDAVLVDLYLGEVLPDFVYSPRFLSSLKSLGNLVVFNHLFYDNSKRQAADKLIQFLTPNFKNVQLHRVLTNLMIICSH